MLSEKRKRSVIAHRAPSSRPGSWRRPDSSFLDREAIRALFGTGFFRDVELRRDGGTLIVAVQERPSIESFEIKGNKDIKTEDMTDSLRNVGLAAGKILNQSTLEEVKQYLTDQYFARGKYNVRINAKVEELQQNRVKVTIDIKEGVFGLVGGS